MICICELNCKQHSHETPNAGMLYGIRLAFPDDEILFYGFTSHIRILKKNLELSNVKLDNIKYRSMCSYKENNFFESFLTVIFIYKIFILLHVNKCDKIFFLSFTAFQNYLIKFLLSLKVFSQIQCVFVLHGALDTLTGKKLTATPLIEAPPACKWVDKLKSMPIRIALKKAIYVLIKTTNLFFKKYVMSFFSFSLDLKKSLLYKNSHNIKYIALSEHILEKLENYIDLKKINVVALPMPAIFENVYPKPNNKYPQFAIFGYGNSGLLQRLNLKLATFNIKNNYEIRIIGMDSRGIEPYPHVVCPIPRVLSRAEMREHIRDIDIVLVLYEKNRYELSCSGSIIEIHSYQKPIFYLENECIQWFNKSSHPIGIECKNIDMLAELMYNYIENFEDKTVELSVFRENILSQRKVINVENNFAKLVSLFE